MASVIPASLVLLGSRPRPVYLPPLFTPALQFLKHQKKQSWTAALVQNQRSLSFESLDRLCIRSAREKQQEKSPITSCLDKEKLAGGNSLYPKPIQEEEKAGVATPEQKILPELQSPGTAGSMFP